MNKLCPEKIYIPTLVVLAFLDFLGTKRNFITFTHTKNKSTYIMHYLPKQLRTLPTSWREYWTSISSGDFCLYSIDNRIFPSKLKMHSLQCLQVEFVLFCFCGRSRRQLINTELSRSSVFSLSHLSWTCTENWSVGVQVWEEVWSLTNGKVVLRSFPGTKQKFWQWTDFAGVLRALDFS